MFVKVHGGESDGRVHVVGGGHQHGVNVFLLFEHLAIVFVAFGLGKMLGLQADHVVQARLGFHGIKWRLGLARARRRRRMVEAVPQLLDVGVQTLETFVRVAPVDVAEGDDVLARQVDEVLAAHAANADAGNV